MKVKVLVDNISDENVKGEWGLCIYIEYHDKKIKKPRRMAEAFLRAVLLDGALAAGVV